MNHHKIRQSAAMLAVGLLLPLLACTPAPQEEVVVAEPEAPPAAPGKLAEIESPGAANDQTGAFRNDTVEIPLAAKGDANGGDKIEYMVRMTTGQPLVYAWTAQGADDFWHEFHGHTEEAVTFYEKAEGAEHQGSLTAPFDGIHGWYFENRTANPVVVRVRLSGFYEPEAAAE